MSTTTSAPPPALPTPVAPPRLAELRRQLRTVFGPAADALVAAACDALSVPAEDPLALDALAAVAQRVAEHGARATLTARAFAVRVRAYRLRLDLERRRAEQVDAAWPPDSAPWPGLTLDAPAVVTPQDRAALEDPTRLDEVARLGLATPAAVAGDPSAPDAPAPDAPALDALLADVAGALDLPTAVVNVLLADAQVWHAAHGIPAWLREAGGVPAEWSACRRVVATGAPVVVPDAAADPLTAHSLFVTQDGMGSYAAVPITSARGAVVGTLCVCGPEPRPYGPAELARLTGAARRVAEHLEARADAPAGGTAASRPTAGPQGAAPARRPLGG